MGELLKALLRPAFAWLADKINDFFKTERGEEIIDMLATAATITSAVAMRTNTAVDDVMAEVLRDLSLSDTPVKTALEGPLGDIIKELTARRLLKLEYPARADSKIAGAIVLSYNQLKNQEES